MYHLPDLRKHLERLHAGHLLDIATGEGDFMHLLLESFSSWDSATGLDTSKESMAAAKEKLAGYKVDFVQGSIRKLPFEENYFDTVSVSNSLHHFEFPAKALISMVRALAPGGLLLVNEMFRDGMNIAQQNHFRYHTLRSDIDTAKGIYHRPIYTLGELTALFSEANIEIDTTILSDNEMPILNSKEKMWQFFRRIDEMVASATQFPHAAEYEERASELKERIPSEGFQMPPQMAFLAYKA